MPTLRAPAPSSHVLDRVALPRAAGAVRGPVRTAPRASASPEDRMEARPTPHILSGAPPAAMNATPRAPQAGVTEVQAGTFCCVGRTREVGEYGRLSGTIEHRSPVAIGGEAPPSGAYLILKKSLHVDGEPVRELFVDSAAQFEEGGAYKLNGRLDRISFGGVETPAQTIYALSGVSNVEPGGEPRYDGRGFTSVGEQPLTTLTYNRPLMYDAPATLIVPDPTQGRAFIGSLGGFIPPDRNPFHGFRGSAPIEVPTQADLAAVAFDEAGQAIDRASGEPLELIGTEGEGTTHPDALSTRWFFSERLQTAFAFQSGGIAGFQNRMSAVVRAGEV